MNDVERALKYADDVFSATSGYELDAARLVRICDNLLATPHVFPGFSTASQHQRIDDEPIEALVPAIRGHVELKLMISPMSHIMDKKSFLCSVMALDVAGRTLDIGGLSRSSKPEIDHYFYIEPSKDGVVLRRFVVPDGATYLRIKVMRFLKSDDDLILSAAFQLLPADLTQLRDKLIVGRGKIMQALRRSRTQLVAPSKAYSKPFLYIMDEFTEACITGSVDAKPLSRTDYINQISKSDSDMLFLESFWRGNGGAWQHGMTAATPHHPNRLALLSAIQSARITGKHIVFYNKEDPMHFDKFLPIAGQADIIFTSDSNSVEKYKAALPGKSVHVLKFAAPSETCNPGNAPTFEKRDTVAFAGGYYGESHEDRIRQMDYMLPAISRHNGSIFDRHSEQAEERYRFPLKYRRFCRQSLPYSEIVKEYRNFRAFLNVNTITDSPTMMSRRVYELLACGTPVVSSPSRAITEQFGDAVSVVETEEDAIRETGRLIEDKYYWMRRSHLGYRHVMKGETYRDRVGQILQTVYPDMDEDAFAPFVSMITPTKQPADYVRIVENAISQTHPHLELVIGFGYLYSEQDVAASLEELARAIRKTGKNLRFKHIHFREKVSLGYKMNSLIQAASGEFVAKMDDDDFYGPNYIADMLLPTRWGGYDLIGKRGTFWHDVATGRYYLKHPMQCHRRSEFVYGATFLGRRTMFLNAPFQERSTGEDTFQLLQLASKGYSIYAADPFCFCVQRRTSNHTWSLPDSFWDKDCEALPEGTNLQHIMI
ncbi:glycosyltransferase family protein [Paracoccus albus]|uniref:glycosyltransferase family protein n=1 Tax=Paracoccus albus TaxID=3017784 RepID=UPI0022F0EE5F|nr:glycosyltransferase [Paracoccus albus]WBU62079.1 glycosyltransferase [Paracoccus albus]